MPFIERPLYTVVVRVVLPPILGAIGAIIATLSPAYYSAMCTTPMIPLMTAVP